MLIATCAGVLALSLPAFGLPQPQGSKKLLQPPRAGRIAPQPQSMHAPLPARTAAMPRWPAAPAQARLAAARPQPGMVQQPMFGWPRLVSVARRYMGTNPTARTRLWCATFMNMVLAKAGYSGTNSDAARSFAYYGQRISEPRIGAIAVLTRGRIGGHVGVVSGIDPYGNPIIISGNHGRAVGEGIYPRSRVIAYVMPSETTAPATQYAERGAIARGPQSRAGSGNSANDSPIAELIASIRSERTRPEPQVLAQTQLSRNPRLERTPQMTAAIAPVRPLRSERLTAQAAKNQPDRDARIALAPPRAPPPEPYRMVQQTPDPAPPSSSFRRLLIDPGLAALIGLSSPAAAKPAGVSGLN